MILIAVCEWLFSHFLLIKCIFVVHIFVTLLAHDLIKHHSLTVVVPKDPYVYIGNELVLSCNLTRPLDEDSKSMYFTRNANERIPSKYVSIVGTRSIKLRMPILSPDDSGNYVCKINKTNGKIGVLGFQVVTVDCKYMYQQSKKTRF